MLFQTPCEALQEQFARHRALRREEVQRDALFQRTHQNVYLPTVRPAEVSE
jgi:hypothetical protein